ncbi:MAG: alginate lyase family protein [Armatimonadetes bacterium]|nr:alginate lyase family protein [Armatimonadota bacterium]
MAILALLCSLVQADAGAWQVRYAQQADQTPEWTAAGYLPTWQVNWVDRDRPEVTWQEPADGRCRGFLLLARRWTVPDPAPREVEVKLAYRTACALPERSGSLSVFAVTEAAWEELPTQPARAAGLNWAALPGVVATTAIRGQGDDAAEWTTAEPAVLTGNWARLAGQTVRLGVAWGCAHFTAMETGGLRDVVVNAIDEQGQRARLFERLDLDRAELAAVRAAWRAGRRAEAEAALAAHYRQRRRPVLGRPLTPATDKEIVAADEVLARTYRLAGCPAYTFAGQVVWNADPFNYDQWAIALNRHFEWRRLASAWLTTKDDKYAREWRDQVRDWVAKMPVIIEPKWIEGPYDDTSHGALSLDAGIRMGQSWFQSFEVLKRSPVVDDETLLTFIASCLRHADYLMAPAHFKHGSNWGCMESNGLYHLGVMLPEFREAALWRDTAARRMAGELDYQVYPDGAQVELAPGYHGVSLSNFLGVLYLARANGDTLPESYVRGLERMFEYYVKIASPDLRYPPLNDSGAATALGIMADGIELFPNNAALRWYQSNRAAGQPPAETSLAMPWAGWVVMRSDWSAQARWLLFGAGPFGTGHQHEDKLGLLVQADGQPLLGEAGIYAYDTSAWRRYVLSTRAHSTVRVDGRDQNCAADRAEYRAAAADTHGFQTNTLFDYARDSHTAGYGTPPDKSVVHRRRVLFIKPVYWLVVDDLAAADARPHVAEAQFLFDAPSAQALPDGTVLGAAGAKGVRLAVVPLEAGAAPRIVLGQKEPEVLGFIAEGFERLRPAPAVLYTVPFTGTATRTWALVPFTGEVPPVAVRRGTTTELDWATRDKHRVTVTPTSLAVETGRGRIEIAEPNMTPKG